MHQGFKYRILTFFCLAMASAAATLAQSPGTTGVITYQLLTLNPNDTWQGAQAIGSSKGRAFSKLFVVTLDQPQRRQACRILSFTVERLVCSRVPGNPRTYLLQQVLALIVPGDGGLRVKLVLGFNAGLGAAIWATVVLAAACPACAVATGIAVLLCFGAAGGTLIADGQPDRLLYVAPGRELSRKLGYVQYRQP